LEGRLKPKRGAGFTLIEIAIVLVILGLLLGLGVGLIGLLVKRAKIMESRETVDAALEALVSYAAGNKCLTDNLTQANVRKTVDAWEQPLFVRVAPELLSNQCSFYNSTICDRKATSLTVTICNDVACTSNQTISNVAFVIASKGPNNNLQIMNGTNEIRVYAPELRVDSYSGTYGGVSDPNRVEEFDDIVKWVTLDELRTKMACPGAQLSIITTELPLAFQNRSYSVSIYAKGGVKPLNWNSPVLPSWLNCTLGSDSTTYNCAGIPSCPGSYTLTVYVEDSSTLPPKSNATSSYTINVQPDPLKLNPVFGITWYALNGTNFSTTINATGGKPPYTFTCTPSSCSGLSCTCSSTGCTISGIANISGNFSITCSFTVTASDSCLSSSQQTASGTYYVVINPSYGAYYGGNGSNGSTDSIRDIIVGGLPPLCTLSYANLSSPSGGGTVIVPYNFTAVTLAWTVTNGPAGYVFNPQMGNCTFGISNGGSCQIPLTTNVVSLPSFTLTLYNIYGSGNCSVQGVKICKENSDQAYRVWLGMGSGYGNWLYIKFPDGRCEAKMVGDELTDSRWLLRPGETLKGYRGGYYYYDPSYGWVWATCSPCSNDSSCYVTSFSYNDAVCVDINGNGMVVMNNQGGGDR
jgi:prepilin-type N-terminal cleavage/methylation domain-containing protein